MRHLRLPMTSRHQRVSNQPPVSSTPVTPLLTSCRADAYAIDICGTHPDEVRRYILDPRFEPGIDERRAVGLGIQMMCRSPRQDDPSLTCLRIDLVDLYSDLVVSVRNTGAQVLVKDAVPRAQDD